MSLDGIHTPNGNLERSQTTQIDPRRRGGSGQLRLWWPGWLQLWQPTVAQEKEDDKTDEAWWISQEAWSDMGV